jgi:hypothetical protein
MSREWGVDTIDTLSDDGARRTSANVRLSTFDFRLSTSDSRNKGVLMVRRSLVITTLALSTFLAMSGAGRAQDATPDAGAAQAGPTACTAEPRDIDAMLALWFDPAGGPVATPAQSAPVTDEATLPQGEKVDEQTEAAITEATENFIYCLEVAGQNARGFSFVTDNLLAQFGPDLANPAQDTPDEVRAALQQQLAGTPIAGVALSPRMPPLAGPRKPRLLEDGRVGAIWALVGNRVFIIYAREGDRWLIDDVIDIIEPPATPAATPAP